MVVVVRNKHVPIVVELDVFRVVENGVFNGAITEATATGRIDPLESARAIRVTEIQHHDTLPEFNRGRIGMECDIEFPGFCRVNCLYVLRSIRSLMYNGRFVGIGVYFRYLAIAEPGIEIPVVRAERNKVSITVGPDDRIIFGFGKLCIALAGVPGLPWVKGKKDLRDGFVGSSYYSGNPVYGQAIRIQDTLVRGLRFVKSRHDILLLIDPGYAPCTAVPPGHEYIAFGIQFEVLAIDLRRSKRSWLIGRFPVTCHGSDLRLSGIGECF